MQHFTQCQAIFKTSAEEGKKTDYWSSEAIFLLVLSLGLRFNSVFCLEQFTLVFPTSRKSALTTSVLSLFLGGICQNLLLNLIQVSHENSIFWLMQGALPLALRKLQQHYNERQVLFPPPLSYCMLPSNFLYLDWIKHGGEDVSPVS